MRGAGRLFPGTTARPLQPRRVALQFRRSLRRLRTAAVLQSRVEPVAVPAAAGRAVVGGGVTDPTVEIAPPTNDEVLSCPCFAKSIHPALLICKCMVHAKREVPTYASTVHLHIHRLWRSQSSGEISACTALSVTWLTVLLQVLSIFCSPLLGLLNTVGGRTDCVHCKGD